MFQVGQRVVYAGTTVDQLKGVVGRVTEVHPDSVMVGVDWGKPLGAFFATVPQDYLRPAKVEYAVSINGALGWGQYTSVDKAMARAASLAQSSNRTQMYQGFNYLNQSAVVTKPVKIRVEELWWNGERWLLGPYHQTYLGGILVTDEMRAILRYYDEWEVY